MAAQTARREPWPAARRFKVKFPDLASFAAASALESEDLPVAVASAKRLLLTLSVPAFLAGDVRAEQRLDQRLEFFAASYGATFAEDEKWDLDAPPLGAPEDFTAGPSLDDVLVAINAPVVWSQGNRGAGATIAVVDTGIAGQRRELAEGRRRGSWQAAGARSWQDPVGHGTMCAVIAAGNRKRGGRFDGVAPEAGIIACRTRFFDSELAAIYDYLTGLLVQDPGLRLVVNNSFGCRHGGGSSGSDFPAALQEAVEAGMAVLFSAGNNHQLAGGLPEHCHPSTIWNHKLRKDVLTVGACDLEGEIWDYSSRGPATGPGRGSKPDVVAPVPRQGMVAFGEENRRFPNGWGTSGACPQAAGLAALLWSAEPDLGAREIFERIRQSAEDLGRAGSCQGSGRINCAAAVAGRKR
jgi:serine protease AprX